MNKGVLSQKGKSCGPHTNDVEHFAEVEKLVQCGFKGIQCVVVNVLAACNVTRVKECGQAPDRFFGYIVHNGG